MPLPIPAGWKVVWHTWCPVSVEEAIAQNGAWNCYFTEDMLFLQHIEQEIYLDVGWEPDMDLSGHYKLCVRMGDEEEPLYQLESRSLLEITESLRRSLVHYTDDVELKVGNHLLPLRIPPGWEIRKNCWIPIADRGGTGALPAWSDSDRPMLEAARYRFRWIHVKVSAHSQPAPGFHLEIRSEDDPAFHKEIWIGDEAKAVSVLENWLEHAPLYNLGQLADG